jgi:hypothetical protein
VGAHLEGRDDRHVEAAPLLARSAGGLADLLDDEPDAEKLAALRAAEGIGASARLRGRPLVAALIGRNPREVGTQAEIPGRQDKQLEIEAPSKPKPSLLQRLRCANSKTMDDHVGRGFGTKNSKIPIFSPLASPRHIPFGYGARGVVALQRHQIAASDLAFDDKAEPFEAIAVCL